MSNIEKLKDMLDNLINGKSEQAQVSFHSYLADRMKEVVKSNNKPTKNTNLNEKQ